MNEPKRTYRVTVELIFEGIEARNPSHACKLAEAWCQPFPNECDKYRSYAAIEPIPEGQNP